MDWDKIKRLFRRSSCVICGKKATFMWRGNSLCRGCFVMVQEDWRRHNKVHLNMEDPMVKNYTEKGIEGMREHPEMMVDFVEKYGGIGLDKRFYVQQKKKWKKERKIKTVKHPNKKMITIEEKIRTMKREISGFGGNYEKDCRKMLIAGLKWLEDNPKANPVFHGYKGVYGIISEDNEDGKVLSKAVVDGSDGNCSGAMHQAVIQTIFWIMKKGIDKYLKQMNEEE